MFLKNVCFSSHITSTFAFSYLIANISNKAVKQLFMLFMLVPLYMKILWAHWHSFILFFKKNIQTDAKLNTSQKQELQFGHIPLRNLGEGVSVKTGKILTKLFFMGSVSWQQRNKT